MGRDSYCENRGRRVGLLTAAVLLLSSVFAAAAQAITVQGEAPARTNIPTATDARASDGAYLALDSAHDPGRRGWYATYEVEAPAAGPYRLDAVLTSPAVPDRRPFGGSQFNLSVNGAPFAQVAKSEPFWAGFCAVPPTEPPPAGKCEQWGESAPAWGALIHSRLDDVELRRGRNRIAFMVDERRISASPQLDEPAGAPAPPRYRFSLDDFTLTPAEVAVAHAFVGDPARNLGVVRGGRARLTLELNARTPQRRAVAYRVLDYFGNEVAAGSATVRAGARAARVRLPALPPGSYRVEAEGAVGNFARLPDQPAVDGAANRFGATVSTPWLVPSSKLDAFAAAVRRMGVRHVRDEISWPLAEPERGAYDTAAIDRIARVYRRHGLDVLGAWWNIAGSARSEAPSWAMSATSTPLPDDLRDGYAFARRVAAQPGGVGADALELWNEPDLDDTSSTGDQQAAWVKAAALGVGDAPGRRLISLPGLGGWSGVFQDLMLQNDVVRYADVWAYHVYAFPYEPGGLTPFPLEQQTELQHELARLYGPAPALWSTEAGIFAIPPAAGHDLDRGAQIDQARYLVQAAVQDLSAGTDRHYWFSAAPYCANGFGCFGLFSGDFQPWPSYSAYAALASILGRAEFVEPVEGLPENVSGFLFKNGRKAVTVVWADEPTEVELDVPGGEATVYDVMGARRGSQAGGPVPLTASLDPQYVVSDGGGELHPRPVSGQRRGEPTRAQRVVLSQRYAAANAAPGKEDGEAEPPLGYRLGATTEMAVDVYNFADGPQTVTVSGRAWGGWSVSGPRTVVVPAGGRVRAPFTISAGDELRRQVDYPLVFEARADGRAVPPSVARIQRRGGSAGEPLELAPTIADVAVDDDGRLQAQLSDALSGIDPARIEVELDGEPVAADFDPASGRLSASLELGEGTHEVWIRVFNNARAPAQATLEVDG